MLHINALQCLQCSNHHNQPCFYQTADKQKYETLEYSYPALQWNIGAASICDQENLPVSKGKGCQMNIHELVEISSRKRGETLAPSLTTIRHISKFSNSIH